MVSEFQQAMLSLNAAVTIGKVVIDLRDYEKSQLQIIKFNDAVIDAQLKIVDIQNHNSTLVSRISELEKKCTQLENHATKEEQYSRKLISTGSFAYIQNDFVGNFKDAHKFCCNCFEKGEYITLSEIKMAGKINLLCSNKCSPLQFKRYNNC